MKVKLTDQIPTAPKGGEIPLNIFVRDRLTTLGSDGMEQLCQGLRLDLQGRILSLTDLDLIKLQGKLDYVNELEHFLLSLLK